MDSSSSSPRDDRYARSIADDDENSNYSLLFQWACAIKPLYKALSIVICSCALSALLFSSVPLWRPVGVLLLHKLWDILRFLVLATSIGLGIINSAIWRGNSLEQDTRDGTLSSENSTEDSVSSKVPFVGMFYGELQSSFSFDEKEPDMEENGLVRKSESGNDVVGGMNSAALVTDNENKFKSENSSKLVNDTIICNVSSTMVSNTHAMTDIAEDDEFNNERVVEEPSVSLPSSHNVTNVASNAGKSELRKARDDLGIGIVNKDEQPKRGGMVIHRRGNSLEFPIQQAVQKHRDIHPVMDHHQTDVHVRSSSSRKGPSSATKVSDHVKRQSNELSNSKIDINPVSASTSTSVSRHSRSRSAYDLNELLMYERRPKSKPGATSQLARRRNVSLSCDMDKEYTVGGLPRWLEGLPSPPVPSKLVENFGSMDANGGVLSSEQDESSLRKACTESLAPWRVATMAMPGSITHMADADKSRKSRTTKGQKKAPLKEITEVTPPSSSPSTPNSYMGSPSLGELNQKVDAFIARFHEGIRLERLKSLERSRQRAQ